jgi:hypothetical protein
MCGTDLLAGINALYPTLLSPNSTMIGFYWAVLYTLQSEFGVLRRC